MTPDELAAVERSWQVLCPLRDGLVDHLAGSFGDIDRPDAAETRARWVVDAVAELVGLLTAPSVLGERARDLATTWPVEGAAPTFRVEGRAWMDAARDVCPAWTERSERAWLHVWLLLSDVLAEESLSPFATPPAPFLTTVAPAKREQVSSETGGPENSQREAGTHAFGAGLNNHTERTETYAHDP